MSNDLLTLSDKITLTSFRYIMHKIGEDGKNTISGLSLTYTQNIRSSGQLFKFNLIMTSFNFVYTYEQNIFHQATIEYYMEYKMM